MGGVKYLCNQMTSTCLEMLHSATITAYSRVSQFSDILAQRRQSIYTGTVSHAYLYAHRAKISLFSVWVESSKGCQHAWKESFILQL